MRVRARARARVPMILRSCSSSMSSSGLVGIERPANSVRWSLSHLGRGRGRGRFKVGVRGRVRV